MHVFLHIFFKKKLTLDGAQILKVVMFSHTKIDLECAFFPFHGETKEVEKNVGVGGLF